MWRRAVSQFKEHSEFLPLVWKCDNMQQTGKPVHCDRHLPTFLSGIMSLLKCGDVLKHGQWLRSGNGRFTLCMQPDGNLVVYSGGNPIWASRTEHKGCQPFRLVMQEDSNLCIYDGTGRCTWASDTWKCGKAGAWVTMQVWANLNGKAASIKSLNKT